MKIKPHLIIGLGNPGPRYDSTYHNVGALAADHLTKAMKMTMTIAKKDKKKNFEFVKFVNDQSIVFIKPLTFMNESGEAVAASLKYFKAKPSELLVIHDDSDIELGKAKLSFGRGAGGHRGVESIIDDIKTKKFWRLRIGIRKTQTNTDHIRPNTDSQCKSVSNQRKSMPKRKKAGEIVLEKIKPADKLLLEQIFNELKFYLKA